MASTNRSLRCKLQALAWTCLSQLKRRPTQPLKAVASDEESDLILIAKPKGSAVQTSDEDVYRLLFSPIEKRILQAIGAGKLSAKDVGKKTQELDSNGYANSLVRHLLQNLVDRKVLDDGDGYVLTPDGAELARRLGLLEAA